MADRLLTDEELGEIIRDCHDDLKVYRGEAAIARTVRDAQNAKTAHLVAQEIFAELEAKLHLEQDYIYEEDWAVLQERWLRSEMPEESK